MWKIIAAGWLRYVIVIVISAIVAAPWAVRILGPEVIAYIQRESTVTQLVLELIALGTIAWGTRNKIFARLETLKARVRNRTTPLVDIKTEVKEEASKPAVLGGLIALPSKEQRAEAFHTETPVERVMSN